MSTEQTTSPGGADESGEVGLAEATVGHGAE